MRQWRQESGRAFMILVLSTRSEWEITFVLVQKGTNGSICKLSHYCFQSVQSHKPWKVREAQVIQGQARLNLNFAEIFSLCSCNLDVSLWQRNSNTTKFGFFWSLKNRFGHFLGSIYIVWIFVKFFIWQPYNKSTLDGLSKSWRNELFPCGNSLDACGQITVPCSRNKSDCQLNNSSHLLDCHNLS